MRDPYRHGQERGGDGRWSRPPEHYRDPDDWREADQGVRRETGAGAPMEGDRRREARLPDYRSEHSALRGGPERRRGSHADDREPARQPSHLRGAEGEPWGQDAWRGQARREDTSLHDPRTRTDARVGRGDERHNGRLHGGDGSNGARGLDGRRLPSAEHQRAYGDETQGNHDRHAEHDWRDELGLGGLFGRQPEDHDRGQRESRGSGGFWSSLLGHASEAADGQVSAPRQGPAADDDPSLHLDWERSGRLRGDYGDYGHAMDDRHHPGRPDGGGSFARSARSPGWTDHQQGDASLESHGPASTGPKPPGIATAKSGPAQWQRARAPRGYQRTDERIREDICERLMADPYFDVGDVSVEVHNGLVILDGSVSERTMRFALESVAAACMGVKDVDNRVRVTGADNDPKTRAVPEQQGNPEGTETSRHGTDTRAQPPSGDSTHLQARNGSGSSSPSAPAQDGMANSSLSEARRPGDDTSRFIRTHTD